MNMRKIHMRGTFTIGGMLIALVAMSGCETSPSETEADYGNSVRAMVRNQTVNPAPADAATVDTGDGVRAQNTLEVYRTDVARPEEVKKDLIIDVGGNR
jgi:hypothetical protein